MKERRKISRSIALFLSLCVLIVLIHFSVFRFTHFIHHCTGPTCQVCHELMLANQMVKQMALGVGIGLLWMVEMLLGASARELPLLRRRGRTLVLDKVRMDD